ncbi:hypothetical protein SEA_ASEGATO_112 [Microbacterium phage ASegato]|nr:hypothetical protein SEA_ASEGATO_112 [Microbacterium phage ASegato]
MSVEWHGWSNRAWGYSRAMRIWFLGPVTIYLKWRGIK